MKNYIIILLAIVFVATSCKTNSINSKSNDMVNANYEIAIGETLEIKLDANPTTGYTWNWANKENITIVDSVGYSYIADEPIRAGSGGTDVWKFIGVKEGEEIIVLEYARSWESQTPEKIEKIVIKVKK